MKEYSRELTFAENEKLAESIYDPEKAKRREQEDREILLKLRMKGPWLTPFEYEKLLDERASKEWEEFMNS